MLIEKLVENSASFLIKKYLHFENVCATTLNTYIQVSRIFNQHNIVNDNGRVVSGSFDIYVTEYDWKCYIEFCNKAFGLMEN